MNKFKTMLAILALIVGLFSMPAMAEIGDVTALVNEAGTEVFSIDQDGVCTVISFVAPTVDINGGTIDGTTVGANTPSTGVFTTLSGSSSVVIPEKTPVNAEASEGLITMSGVASADSTFIVDTQTFTWKVTRTGTGEVTIGDNADSAITNIVTAITADLATVTAAYTSSSTSTITAATKGVAGDLIDFTEDSTNMDVDGAGTLGTTTPGVDGTVGVANETCADGSNLYHCIDTNTIADSNWRLISLGAVY